MTVCPQNANFASEDAAIKACCRIPSAFEMQLCYSMKKVILHSSRPHVGLTARRSHAPIWSFEIGHSFVIRASPLVISRDSHLTNLAHRHPGSFAVQISQISVFLR